MRQLLLLLLLLLLLQQLIFHHFCEAAALDAADDDAAQDSREFCRRGHFLDVVNNACRPCPDGHFMPDSYHSQLRCYPCQHARLNKGEIELEACTDSFDTVIGCEDGYFYRQAAGNDDDRPVKCTKCTDCSEVFPNFVYEIRPCSQSVDTLCCLDPDMKAVRMKGKAEYRCHARKTPRENKPAPVASYRTTYMDQFCTCGQYLELDTHTCEVCPDDYFMHKEKHTNTKCYSCELENRNPERDIMDCRDKCKPPKTIGCKANNYFGKSNYGRSEHCFPCKDCSLKEPYEGRRCSNESNRICCPEENMTVDDSNGTCVIKPTEKTTTLHYDKSSSTNTKATKNFSSTDDYHTKTPNRSIEDSSECTTFKIWFGIASVAFSVSFIVNIAMCFIKKKKNSEPAQKVKNIEFELQTVNLLKM